MMMASLDKELHKNMLQIKARSSGLSTYIAWPYLFQPKIKLQECPDVEGLGITFSRQPGTNA